MLAVNAGFSADAKNRKLLIIQQAMMRNRTSLIGSADASGCSNEKGPR